MEMTGNRFLGLDGAHADYKASRYAVLPIPYDGTTSYLPGTRLGPQAILSASQQVELYDHELGGEYHGCGIATLEPIHPVVSGPEAMLKRVHAQALRTIKDDKFLMSLGGEHSITSALVSAVKSKHKKLSVLQIDAHADLRDQYEDSPYSHACVMRRICEMDIPMCGVGIRNYSKQEASFIKKNKLKLLSAHHCNTCVQWQDQVLSALTDKVYVTVDIDGFDPAYAPGTGTPEPGGLDWYQVSSLLDRVAQEKEIVAADVVEVLPVPGQAVTEFLAAKLVYKLICLVEHHRRHAL